MDCKRYHETAPVEAVVLEYADGDHRPPTTGECRAHYIERVGEEFARETAPWLFPEQASTGPALLGPIRVMRPGAPERVPNMSDIAKLIRQDLAAIQSGTKGTLALCRQFHYTPGQDRHCAECPLLAVRNASCTRVQPGEVISPADDYYYGNRPQRLAWLLSQALRHAERKLAAAAHQGQAG